MPKRALVLGGGGPVGIAWESGLIAGLAEGGVNLGEADRFIGTSAGSVVGAQLALGRTPREMVEPHLAPTPPPAPGAGPTGQAPNIQPLLEFMARSAGNEDPEALRREIGRFAMEAKTISEADFIAGFGRTLASATGWPSRDYVCTAVDCEDGSFRAWDAAAKVDLPAAIASSCSVPGIFPPITINGRRYMDGGMRSATNADLAQAFDKVLIVAVTTGEAPANATAMQRQMAENSRRRLASEVATLRNAGSTVTVLAPDDASRAAFGPNLMDYARRGPAAQAGLEQGRTAAAALKAAWD